MILTVNNSKLATALIVHDLAEHVDIETISNTMAEMIATPLRCNIIGLSGTKVTRRSPVGVF